MSPEDRIRDRNIYTYNYFEYLQINTNDIETVKVNKVLKSKLH